MIKHGDSTSYFSYRILFSQLNCMTFGRKKFNPGGEDADGDFGSYWAGACLEASR